jgi:hypothetical protein
MTIPCLAVRAGCDLHREASNRMKRKCGMRRYRRGIDQAGAGGPRGGAASRSTGVAAGSANTMTAQGVGATTIAAAIRVGGAQPLPEVPVQPSQWVQVPWLVSAGDGIAGRGPWMPTVVQKSV